MVEGGGMEWESNQRDILIEKVTVGLGRNMVLGKSPRIHKDDPQLRLLAIMKRVSELAYPSNQIGEYSNCHHRVFIQ